MNRGPLLFLLSLVLLVPPASAATEPPGDPTPNAPNAVDARYAMRLREDFSGFDATVALEIHEIEVAARQSLPAAAIRALPSKDVFEAAVEERVTTELSAAFPKAALRLTQITYDYGSTADVRDAYHPAIHVVAAASIDFTAAYMGLSSLGDATPSEAARAFFYSGGAYTIEENVMVPAGMAIGLTVDVPAQLVIEGEGLDPGQRISVERDNLLGAHPVTLPIAFSLRLQEDAIPSEVLRGPLVAIRIDVEDATPGPKKFVPWSQGDFAGTIDIRIEVTSLEARYFAGYPLPDGLATDRLSADVLRVAFQAGIVRPADVEAFFETLIERSLRQGFGNETVVTFDATAFAESVASPVGGSDGATVEPLVVRATSAVPVDVKGDLVASGAARGLAMVLPSRDTFEIANTGSWTVEYTFVYPKGLHVSATDSLGLVQQVEVDGRDALRLQLAPGEATDVTVTGRIDFEPVVFGAQATAAAAFLALVAWGGRRLVALARAGRGSTI